MKKKEISKNIFLDSLPKYLDILFKRDLDYSSFMGIKTKFFVIESKNSNIFLYETKDSTSTKDILITESYSKNAMELVENYLVNKKPVMICYKNEDILHKCEYEQGGFYSVRKSIKNNLCEKPKMYNINSDEFMNILKKSNLPTNNYEEYINWLGTSTITYADYDNNEVVAIASISKKDNILSFYYFKEFNDLIRLLKDISNYYDKDVYITTPYFNNTTCPEDIEKVGSWRFIYGV